MGVVLPLLPTTPLVLLAAFCFSKSSPRLRAWLEDHATFGPLIVDWETHGAIAPRYKVIASSMMGGVFILSVIMGLPFKVLVIQGVFLAASAAFVLSRPNGDL